MEVSMALLLLNLSSSTDLLSSSSALPTSASPSNQCPFVLDARHRLIGIATYSGNCSALAAIMPASAAHNLPPASLCRLLLPVSILPNPCVSWWLLDSRWTSMLCCRPACTGAASIGDACLRAAYRCTGFDGSLAFCSSLSLRKVLLDCI